MTSFSQQSSYQINLRLRRHANEGSSNIRKLSKLLLVLILLVSVDDNLSFSFLLICQIKQK